MKDRALDKQEAPPASKPSQFLAEDRLDSWKEIAVYLKREVRTVQRWEKAAGLPVHRLQVEKQGSVYTYRSELDAWQLRHSDPRITLGTYGHVIGNQQRDAVENRSARIEKFAVN